MKHKLLKTSLISIVILLAVFGIVQQINAQWTVDGLDYTTRKKLTIDHDKIDDTLTDLPVLVKLTDANFDFDKDNDDGFDIRFTEDDGETLLKFERERHTDPTAEYWVKVGSVSSSSDTDFYIYYSTTDTADGADPTNVWDANYKGVWHLKEDPSGAAPQAQDSTSNERHATSQNMEGEDLQNAVIGEGWYFDGTNEGATFTSASLGTQHTGEFWLRRPVAGYDIIIGDSQYYYIANCTTTNIYYRIGSGTFVVTSHGMTVDVWYHWAVTRSGTTVKFYRDGIQRGTTKTLGLNDPLAVSRIASGGGEDRLQGTLDEVRICDDARTAAEIKADYNSGNDSLLTYGTEESSGPLETCSSQGGTCCSSGQTCSGGSFVNSSDCGNLCCTGGTCQTPPQDTTPPVISNVSTTNITSNSAVITWTTDESATSQVEYGSTTSYGNTTALDSSLVVSHSTALSGLSSNTTYHYKVISQDSSGNSADSIDYTFISLQLPAGTDPQITYVSSAVQQGQDITISGLNFGTKEQVAPLLWDGFEWGNDGDPLSTGGWTHWQSGTSTIAEISSTKSNSGTRSAYAKFGEGTGDWQAGYKQYTPSLKIYASYMIYFDAPNPSDCDCGLKAGRITSSTQTGDVYGGQPCLMIYGAPQVNWYYATMGNGGGGVTTTTHQWLPGQWHRIEYWMTLSDPPGAENGYCNIWIDMRSSGAYTGITRVNDNTDEFNAYMSPHMWPRHPVSAEVWVDDIYIANTFARVEIGDAPAWDACTHREIQIPVAWSDGSITFTANQGSFSDGEPAYLYVVDENGDVNEQGYQIAFGPAGPDTAPPIRSQGLPSGTLASGTASATLSLATNETSTCKYSTTAGVSFSAMSNTFLTTGATSHSTTITGLSNGNTYAYYIKCQDTSGNANTNDYLISFSVPIAPPSDTTPPSAITNLSVSNISQTSVNLSWTAPGDDGNSGTASSYDIRYSFSAITESNWSSASLVTGEPSPSAAGTSQSYTLTGLSPNTTYYFALKAKDEVPNWSGLSNVVSAKTQSNICTSFTYSSWSACQSNNTQSRTVISALPIGCIGGNPILSQSCTYTPPTCTSFTYSNWSACQSNNTQTRTIVSQSPQGCIGGNPILSESCTYIPVPPFCTSFTYSNWNECQSNNIQTRTIVSQLPQDCDGGNPVLSQSCTYTPPPCTSFTYSNWSACQPNNTQSRIVSEQSPLGCIGGNLILSQSCSYTPPGGGGGGGGGAPTPSPTPSPGPGPGQEITPPEEPINLMTITELKAKIAEIRGKIAELKALLIQILKQKIAEIIVKIGELRRQLENL